MEINFISHLNSLEKKLYQLIISRLDGDKVASKEYQEKIIELVKKGIGGFILFGGRKYKIKDFIDKIQSVSEIPLFIASDIERGVGQQIKNTTIFPCQMAMAAAINKNNPEDVSLLRSAVKAIADESKDVGINMPLIPVLDVNQNPDNPIICTRAFSDNPVDVAWFGSEYIKILEESGLISCAKHFPGHGDTAIDSHISLPVITKSRRDLMTTDIMPFVEAINTGASSIMIGHLSVPSVDSKPASLSKMIITDLLRKELGFNGLILSDALNMDALRNFENIPTECINSGVDVLLHPVDADLTVKELISALNKNKIKEEQIDAVIGRVVKIKARIQYVKKTAVAHKQHVKLSEHITEMSITLVKDKKGLLPISDPSRIHVVFAGDRRLYKSSLLKNYFEKATEVFNTDDIESEIAVFALFTSVAAWKGSSGIDNEESHHISELIRKAKNSIVISFGSPYVLRHFKEADVLIAAYETTEQAQSAVLKGVKREIDFKGHLPVKLNIKP
ncbi:MAG: hypothetical protein OEZ31_04330 [Nitrospirota bacterium]|nr:hypothetical protein [Nitrospirota bacterium]MDH5768169.1 hypothetical protein [Nitrospirota bacterium]